MMSKSLVAVLVATGLLFTAAPARAQEDQALTVKQAEAVRKVVRDYLMEHPEVIGEAIEALREKMRAEAEADGRKMISAHKDELFKSADDPFAGNPKGDVVLVEFFDYNCGFCKQTLDAMVEAVKADGRVKLVYKEFPILGPDSVLASRVALLAKEQGKYDDLHRAFMKYRGRLDEKTIWRIAGEVGMNVDKARKELLAPAVEKQLKKNGDLAHTLGIGGTPTFVLTDRIISSALDQQAFRQLFDAARKANKGG